MSLLEAKQHCSLLVQRVSRSQRYAEISDRIIHALKTQITPVIEQSSIDEAYLELTAEQELQLATVVAFIFGLIITALKEKGSED